MKLTVRRIGNSLGVIIPKDVLERWGVPEGGALELGERGISPRRAGLTKADLDELRLERSLEIVRRFTPREIRAKGLANLHRWKAQGSWGKVYDEWAQILEDPDDGRLYAAMLGRDERSVRLRQSAPYVGLLPQELVREMNEKVPG
jgi:antitoxin component of MazEF toxin-antitoxin module